MDRVELDLAIRLALADTLASVGDDCLESVLSLLGGGHEAPLETVTARLGDLDNVLDEMFTRFAIVIKQITILQACSRLKMEPPKLGKSLFWMVEELHANMWKDVR